MIKTRNCLGIDDIYDSKQGELGNGIRLLCWVVAMGYLGRGLMYAIDRVGISYPDARTVIGKPVVQGIGLGGAKDTKWKYPGTD